MFLPISTDAPVYHWPIATVGLIVANVLAFVGVAAGALPMDPTTGDPWLLVYGDGLHPQQWFCSAFMHMGPVHLLGNMVFLWVFGLVVEGKLGWRRFLPIYLVIAVGESALEQLLMLGVSEGVSLGASSAIYGVLAIAAIWAPVNNVKFLYWIMFVGGTFEAPLFGVAVFYIGMDLLMAVLAGGLGMGVTGSLLHLLGAAIGAPLGVLLLKRGVVDCEGWDAFSRYNGGKKKSKKQQRLDDQKQRQQEQQRAEQREQDRALAQKQFDASLANGAPLVAHKLFRQAADAGLGWSLDPPRLRALVKGLQAEGRWDEVAPLVAELILKSPERADGYRVTLAQICVLKLERPGRALELLAEVDPANLSDKQRQVARSLRDRAEQMQAAGAVELDDAAW